MKVLVTGGLGFIGSHTVVELLNKGEEVVIIDSLVNASISVLERITTITGRKPRFYQFDLRDHEQLDRVFADEKVDAVIHFAGLKAVGESVEKPVLYYDNNLGSTIALIEAMIKHHVNKIAFSSSATVYGTAKDTAIVETDPVGGTTNPYGTTKFMIEQILKDVAHAVKDFNVAILRYFNPIGAHASGLIGEDPNGIPNNLMPYISQVAIGKLDHLNVFGNDYPTIDGTGVRDYIHVVDLALGHVAALKKLDQHPGVVIYNFGTGRGTSVLELVAAFEKATKTKIPLQYCARRAGDIATSFAGASKAEHELGWKAERTIEDACRDAWKWQQYRAKHDK